MVSRTEKFRGSRTHGRGMKSGRGKGKRGGSGQAGLHKHKYIHTVKFDPMHFGRHGFKRPQSVVSAHTIVNVDWLAENARNAEYADTSGKMPVIDLGKHGIDKLLGNGNIDVAVKVVVDSASEKAKEKVKSAGGEIITSDAVEEKGPNAKAADVKPPKAKGKA